MCRKTYAEVSLNKLKNNAEQIVNALPDDKKLFAVVKADAYGHGLVPCSKAFLAGGAYGLCVALAEEGAVLRKSGVQAPILVLTPQNKDGIMLAAKNKITISLHNLSSIEHIIEASKQYGDIELHIALNTGLNRDGLNSLEELKQALLKIQNHKAIHLTGVFSHFADAENTDESFSLKQIESFKKYLEILPKGLLVHMSASAAAQHYKQAIFDAVRCGISLYGYPPLKTKTQLTPALSLMAEISGVKTINAGESVGYSCTYTANKPTKVATLAIGYADGLSRSLSNKGVVLVAGKRCPIIGSVCMDQLMVDVSGIENVKPGDTAVLIGTQGESSISTEEMASYSGTIVYEVFTALSQRLPKLYTTEE
ncbi:MAG: alanine racemase [Eubacteriales bacterium]|nr:alanine racemase [Eubacteriales bacterium]